MSDSEDIENEVSRAEDASVEQQPLSKEEAAKILKEVGLSMSTAINLFLKQVINHNGLPFEVRKPNEDTLRALKKHKT